jgi:adenylate cyclase
MSEQTANPDAVRALAHARTAHDQIVSPENDRFIRDLVRQALAGLGGATPPWLAEAWALLADVLASDYLHRWNGAGTDQLDEAQYAVDQAFAIDDRLALAHYACGFVKRARGLHQDALAAFDRALELDSDFARASAQKGNELINLGRPGEAPALVQKAIELSPQDPSLGMFYWIMGRAYFFDESYDAAITWLEKSIEARPTVWYNRLYLVSAYALQGDVGKARDVLENFRGRFPGYTLARVIENEHANPNANEIVVSARGEFHAGLLAAGLEEK